MAIRTVFTMAEDCARGERQGWEEFVRDYAGVTRRLLRHYFSTLTPEIDEHVAAVFQRAQANHAAWFSGLHFSNEREFMMAFRELVFAYGREMERVPVPQISLDQLRQIMQDLTVIERELLWLFIKGYDAQQIAAIMMNASATSEAVKKIADQRLAQVIPGATPDAFTISARVLMEAAEKTKSEQCLSLKTFNNIVNGQISWRERELAEEHLHSCFYCIDRFTGFQEMTRLRKDAPALPPEQVAPVLARLKLPKARPRGVFAKLFTRD